MLKKKKVKKVSTNPLDSAPSGIHTTIAVKNSSGRVTEETLFRSPIGLSKNAGSKQDLSTKFKVCFVIKFGKARKLMGEVFMLFLFVVVFDA